MNVENFPVRILHVFGIMNCGGAETFIMNVYRNIDRKKIQFDFIVHTKDKGYYDDEIKALGGRIYEVPRFIGSNLLNYQKAWKLFFEAHSEYGIIHSHIRSTASIFLKIAKKKGLVTIIHSHNTSSGKGIGALTKNLLQLPLRRISDYRFACSVDAGKWLFKDQKFEVINNAIKVKLFKYNEVIRNKYREEFDITNKFVIGHVGRFHEQKNHDFLLEVFKRVNIEDPDTVLFLIGEGDLQLEIEKKINKLNLQNSVFLLGVRSDIPELLQAIDVFAFPSIFEGLGIVVIEAQAAGLPCIVSDTIPREVGITDLVQFLPLQNGIEEWVKEILNHKERFIRTDTSMTIIKRGYEIADQVSYFEKFYLRYT